MHSCFKIASGKVFIPSAKPRTVAIASCSIKPLHLLSISQLFPSNQPRVWEISTKSHHLQFPFQLARSLHDKTTLFALPRIAFSSDLVKSKARLKNRSRSRADSRLLHPNKKFLTLSRQSLGHYSSLVPPRHCLVRWRARETQVSRNSWRFLKNRSSIFFAMKLSAA